jgi:hypothetical protein
MPEICLFCSTEEFDPVSAAIRRLTNCDWSHTGFYSLSDKLTYSAMSDGKGLAWRPVSASQRMLLLNSVGMEVAFQQALAWIGEKYDFVDIMGLLLGKDWAKPNELICDVTVFRAHRLTDNPLVNPTFIPEIHLTPRDILTSPFVSARPQ